MFETCKYIGKKIKKSSNPNDSRGLNYKKIYLI